MLSVHNSFTKTFPTNAFGTQFFYKNISNQCFRYTILLQKHFQPMFSVHNSLTKTSPTNAFGTQFFYKNISNQCFRYTILLQKHFQPMLSVHNSFTKTFPAKAFVTSFLALFLQQATCKWDYGGHNQSLYSVATSPWGLPAGKVVFEFYDICNFSANFKD